MVNLPTGYIMYGDEPKIKHNTDYGYYVIICSVDPRPRLTDDQRYIYFYLHSDGGWRSSTLFKGKYTGYYKTKESAELALKSAIGDTND